MGILESEEQFVEDEATGNRARLFGLADSIGAVLGYRAGINDSSISFYRDHLEGAPSFEIFPYAGTIEVFDPSSLKTVRDVARELNGSSTRYIIHKHGRKEDYEQF